MDGWFYTLEEDVLAEGRRCDADERSSSSSGRTGELLEQRLAKVTSTAPDVQRGPAGLSPRPRPRATRRTAEGILAWLAGQPNVAAAAKRSAGVKGDIDHFGALSFLQGVLTVLRDSGHPGLLRCPRRGRDDPAGSERRPRQEPQRPAAVDR